MHNLTENEIRIAHRNYRDVVVIEPLTYIMVIFIR